MKLLIIDYGAGNVKSVSNALRLVSEDVEITVSNKIEDFRNSEYIILPGVGNFSDCIQALKSIDGLVDEIKNQVLVEKKPFLGVCVGMQVLASIGYEDGTHEGLNLIEGEVKKIPNKTADGQDLKVPHMGWNNVIIKEDVSHPILEGVNSGDHFYFANSYYFLPKNEDERLAYANYGEKITSVIAKDNIFATQFHPEKSGDAGLKILKNFLNWKV